jgi:hypothetical protein
MSDYEPIHDKTTGQFTEQSQSTPEKPIVPPQFRLPVDPNARRIQPLFKQELSDDQEDTLLHATYILGTTPFIQPSSVRLPSGLEGPAELTAYFIEDTEVTRMTVDVDGTVTRLELLDGDEWADLDGGGVWEDLHKSAPADLDTRNSFADPLSEAQDRVLLRFNDFRYGLNTSTRPDGQGGVEAINMSTDNDQVRRIRVNAAGYVTSFATLETTGPAIAWEELDPESELFTEVANDWLSYEDRVRRMGAEK